MSQRFQIEDLVIQDTSGVVFRALDTETKQTVAVRRFFPFGPTGGGLREDEQIAYNIAVERLAGISHPALRSVICGGCDPVDGMPYIATEWVEGTRLQAFLERGPLTSAEATHLLTQALEVCEVLSQVLAEEAVWVETDLQAIIVAAEGSGRGVTFSIAPLRWLGKHDGHRGLEPLIQLTEDIMGWRGIQPANQQGAGIGGWLKWFRGKARTTTLHEAREMLAASIGVEPPVPAKRLVRQATRPVVPVRKTRSRRLPTYVFAITILAALGIGGWALVQRNNSKLGGVPDGIQLETTALEIPPVGEDVPSVASARPEVATSFSEPPPSPRPQFGDRSPEQASRQAAELIARAGEHSRKQEVRRQEIKQLGDVFTIDDRELLLERKGEEVRLEGRLTIVRPTATKVFLEFSSAKSGGAPRGYVAKKDLAADDGEAALQKFIGKKVRLRGKVKTPTSLQRPEIEIKALSSVEEVK